MKTKDKGLKIKDVVLIRKLWLTNRITQNKLSKLFNVSPSTICRIVNNQIHQ